MMTFAELSVGDMFCIPYGLDHSFGQFIKMPFEKALDLQTGSVSHWGLNVTVWEYEP